MKEKFVFVGLCLLLSCTNKSAVPKDVLPVAKMTDVLWDVMLADALANHRYPLDTMKRFDTSTVLYQQIANAHGTTQARLKRSLQFYESRPDLLQGILDSLQKRATIPPAARPGDTSRRKILLQPANPLRRLP
jgi:hypothetical protein